jgi:superfamily II DNA or RNA helicase
MLRPYQQGAIDAARESLFKRGNRSHLIQLPTGGGKTKIFSEITHRAHKNKSKVWIVAPRNKIVEQISENLSHYKVPHGKIHANSRESIAYNVHVVSKDTLIRRYDKIKNWPDLLIIDECHLFYDQQKTIISKLPKHTKIIGFTATPERTDGRGLSEIYDDISYGESIPKMQAGNYLTPLRYFAPPIRGIEKLHRRGTEYDADELEEFFQKNKIYGEVIGHYEKYGKGKSALIFCRTVKSAYETAERFQKAGHKFYCIEGEMSYKEQRALIDALSQGKIDGLTNCEIATYGLDIPRIEYIACLRPTESRALYFQMAGRGLRPYPGKTELLFFDHVGLLQSHGENGVPPFYLDHIDWNFTGTNKRKITEKEPSQKLCPYIGFMYCSKQSCRGCEHNEAGVDDARKTQEIIDVKLEEIKPLKLQDRPPEERREFVDKMNDLRREYLEAEKTGEIKPGIIGELLKTAKDLKRSEMWVYWYLSGEERISVNIPLLHEMARQLKYKPAWVFFKKTEIRKKLDEKRESLARSLGV